RGDDRAELAVGSNDYSYAVGHSDPRNPRDKGGGVHSDCADADASGLAGITARVADIDIVIARGQATASVKAQCNVFAAGCHVAEGLITRGRVADAGCVEVERGKTGGRVGTPGRVGSE